MTKKWFFLFFLLLVFWSQRADAGLLYGFGIGYTAKNVYEDSSGGRETETNVPLLGLSAGYSAKANVVEFALEADASFFAMDMVRGNREFILFAVPSASVSVPLRIAELGISPVVGYGGMHRIRYIKEGTHLSGEDRDIYPANFSDAAMDILYGGSVQYSDWLYSTFLIVGDVRSIHMVNFRIRTPHSGSSVPFISLTYRGGEEARTFGLGLLYCR